MGIRGAWIRKKIRAHERAKGDAERTIKLLEEHESALARGVIPKQSEVEDIAREIRARKAFYSSLGAASIPLLTLSTIHHWPALAMGGGYLALDAATIKAEEIIKRKRVPQYIVASLALKLRNKKLTPEKRREEIYETIERFKKIAEEHKNYIQVLKKHLKKKK